MLEPRPLSSELPSPDLRARAWYYRQMAEAAGTTSVREALFRLAEQYEGLAENHAPRDD